VKRLQSFINRAPREFFRAIESLESSTAEELETVKDNRLRPVLDAILTTAIEASGHEDELIVPTRDAFFRIYERSERLKFPDLAGTELDKEWVWGEVIKRVYLLGAVMLERRKYSHAAELIEQPITWDTYWSDMLWARHALTMLARSHKLDRKGLVSLAAEEFDREPWFLEAFDDDKERGLNGLCQLDFLQCVHVAQRTSRGDRAYPSFSLYDNWRTEPIVSALIADPEARRGAIPEMDDNRLAQIIHALDQVAAREAFAVAGWDSGMWRDRKVAQFLEEHPPRSS
jgi:hypothetical protein